MNEVKWAAKKNKTINLSTSLHWFMQITRHKLQVCHHFNDFDLCHQSRRETPPFYRHYQLPQPKAENCKWLYLNQLETPPKHCSQRQMDDLIDVCFKSIPRAHKLPFGFDYWFVCNDVFQDSRQEWWWRSVFGCNWKHVKAVK